VVISSDQSREKTGKHMDIKAKAGTKRKFINACTVGKRE
jgi:hypothetical protein